MKVYFWDLLPYGKHFEEYTADRYIPYPLSASHFDPGVAARTYEEHLACWCELDQLGFDGVGLNEHHTTPHGLMCSPNMMAAVAAQHTKRLKFLQLGNLLPLHNPLRVAEDIAMADCLSQGRVLAGFARGNSREYKAYNTKQSESRARFEEAFDIIMKAWTEEVFSYEGKFWSFKDVAIWPRPFQQPHPPLYVPFTGSKETIEWAARHNLNAVIPEFHRGVMEDVIGQFAKSLANHGRTISPDQLVLFTESYVAASKQEAVNEIGPFNLYFTQTLWHHGSLEPPQPLGPSYDYIRQENRAHVAIDREWIRRGNRSDLEARVMAGAVNWGSANEVTERLIERAEHAGANAILLNTCNGAVPHELMMEQIRRLGRDVLPRLQAHQVTLVPAAALSEA